VCRLDIFYFSSYVIGDWRRIQDEEFRELYPLEKVNVKLALEQTMKVQRGSRAITVLLDFGARVWWVVTATPRPLYPREGDPVPVLYGRHVVHIIRVIESRRLIWAEHVARMGNSIQRFGWET
jgi:hypothetical protein